MAKITRLASTLIARYNPSKTLQDSFYMDGRLFGKREIRNADITIDKEERGFFFSVFSHPTIPGYEPGMVPPYEPQLRAICNEVKFGRKPIDEMISGFLTSAVDITGKMKLQDQDNRAPYFSGIIVHDSEAFAVTIGTGLAFLYRNDALYPLTDAGIPMEAIDAFGNRVGDFYNYVSSKTANALWSNITTLAVDDCVILCNKAVYDALGQRELLRILDEAEDQCDAAGTVITQAAANMPNVPMQFSISFVESVTADEKKGFFKFGKKNKEENMENMSIKSTFEGGIIGAAAGAVANAGFATGYTAEEAATVTTSTTAGAAIDFGDTVMTTAAATTAATATAANATANAADDLFSFVIPEAEAPKAPEPKAKVDFLDSSVNTEPPKEISAEDMMKTLFGEMQTSKEEGLNIQKKAEEVANSTSPFVIEEPTPAVSPIVEGTAFAPQTSEIPSDSPFVSAYNPFAATTSELMETVSEVPFEAPEDDGMMDTKTVSSFDSLFAQQVSNENGISSNGIIAAALREMQAEKKEETPSETPVVEAVEKAETPVIPSVEIPTVEVSKVEEVKKKEETPVVTAPMFDIPTVESAVTEVPVVANTVPDSTSITLDPVTVNNDEITFGAGNEVLEFGDSTSSAPFNPYGIVGDGEDIQTMKPLVFPGQETGDFNIPTTENNGGASIMDNEENRIDEPSFEWKEEGIPTETIPEDVPAPQFDIVPENQTVNPVENVSFPVSQAPNAEPEMPVVAEAPVEVEAPSDGGFVLPFENAVITEPEQEINNQDIPDMPLYGSQTYDAPAYAVNTEQPIGDTTGQAYSVGEYTYNEDMSVEQAPYQSYGSETIDNGMFESAQAYAQYQAENYGEQVAAPSYDPNVYADPNAYVDPNMGAYTDPNTYADPNAYVDPNMGAYAQEPAYDPNAYTNPEATISVDGMGTPDVSPADDDWMNSILGLTGDENMANGNFNYVDPNADMSKGAPKRPGGSTTTQRPNGNRPSGQPNRNPNAPKRKKKFKLSRNGIIFFAFVGVLIIALIVIFSLIAKSCSNKEKQPVESEPSATIESIETVPTVPHEVDPTAPIGVFVFSDYTGYRTWYDLFNKVYGIQIENEADTRIDYIRQYNSADPAYNPKSGDMLLLPPIGIINGSISMTGEVAEVPVDEPVDAPAVEGEPVVAEQ